MSCKGFYNKKYFSRHKCTSELLKPQKSIILFGLDDSLSPEFSKNVVVSIRSDEAGEVAKTDPIILSLGLEYYKKRYCKEKEAEACMKIRAYMRNLAKITIETKRLAECRSEQIDTKDIFNKTNLDLVESAVNNLVMEDGDVKHGMKVILGYDLNHAIQDLLGLYCMEDNEQMIAQLQKFQSSFKMRWKTMYMNSEMQCKRRRFETLRRPKNQISRETIQQLRNFVVHEIDYYQQCNFPQNRYIDIRNAVFTRLVLYNARRANEISRMKVAHVEDALNGEWLKQGSSPCKHFVCYVPGKDTTKLVSVLVPVELKEAISFLISKRHRKISGILEENEFAFASFHNSTQHVQGTNILAVTSEKAGVKVTGTQVRHYLSSVFAFTCFFRFFHLLLFAFFVFNGRGH